MQLKLFVVPIKNLKGAEAEMNGLLRGHRVLAVRGSPALSFSSTPAGRETAAGQAPAAHGLGSLADHSPMTAGAFRSGVPTQQ